VYHKSHLSYLVIIFIFSSRFQVRFLDQQPFFIHQSALQINFPLHQQQQFDTQSRHLDEQQQQLLQQDNNLLHQHQPVAQGYIDESGNLCIIEYPETADAAVGATNSLSIAKSLSRHGTREKTRSSQKRRKRRKAKQQPAKDANKKDFGEFFKK
jgi:hypothetical protein